MSSLRAVLVRTRGKSEGNGVAAVDAMARRPVAWVGTVVLVLEAIGAVLLNWFLGLVVDRQDMSLAGLDPHAMSVGALVAGGLAAVYLLLCAFALLRTALRDEGPTGFWRILLITAAVVHALLGALCVGPVGWSAFAFMMVVLALIALCLIAYGPEHGRGRSGSGRVGQEGSGSDAAMPTTG